MPPPIPVMLQPHDPRWPAMAKAEGDRLRHVFPDVIGGVDHIGSTAIAGIPAKPVLDLIVAITDMAAFDRATTDMATLGYEGWGEYGLPGRRYFTRDDPVTGTRQVQLHCYAQGSAEITRHVAFRDHLRANPHLAAEYARVKQQCREAHPDNSHKYSDCKSRWIQRMERAALAAIHTG